MQSADKKIREAFEHKRLHATDFAWLVELVEEQGPDNLQLIQFWARGEGPDDIGAVLAVSRERFGTVLEAFADYFPPPFQVQVLNRADPNPGLIDLIISWGQA